MNSFLKSVKEISADPSARLWGGIVVVTILFTALLFLLSPNHQAIAPTKDADPQLLAVRPTDWVHGDTTVAKSILIEYGDFQCPSCALYHSLVRQLETDLGSDIAVIFRHFPLVAIHPNAKLSAQAAEAAGLQGKFFEMHDILFADQKAWSEGSNAEAMLIGYAEQLGLNIDRFKTDLHSDAIEEKINASMQDGNALGIRGTPTFFLNGKLLPQAKSYAEFKNSVVSETYSR